jgi:glutathione reductase (NADPH)
MSETFDLVVIGTGVAARGVAFPCRAAGWKVAVIDSRPVGGTCALRGCDPKKMLLAGAASVDHARRMAGKGVAGEPHIDWPALMEFKRSFTGPMPRKIEESYASQGIAMFHGCARFTGRNRLAVDGTALEARHVVIAAGARPVALGIAGEEHLTTSDDFLELEALPRNIVMVGGGYIAAEFSHIAARAGASVTVLQRGERLLTQFEPELVEWLLETFRAAGIEVRTGVAVEAVEKIQAGYRVTAGSGGEAERFEAELVVHAAGRAPALDALDPEAGEVATEDGRLRLNDYLQSVSNPAVYAAGDAAARGPPLTPVSSHDAEIVAANLLHGNRRKPDYRGVPSVAFTIPPIAAVGLGEAEARRQGLKFRVQTQNASDWFTARQAGGTVYGFKVLVEDGTQRILGAHLVGPHAEEVINLFALAIRHDLTAEELKSAPFAYPTSASDVGSML